MGNKLCKKRVDTTDSPKSSNPFDKIINKFSLKPKWKSDPNLEDKEVYSYQVNAMNEKNEQQPHTMSRSSDWTEIPLEVPEKSNPTHVKNNNLSAIFNDDNTPIPPPRKQKKRILDTVKNAFQSKKPVDEELCIKKTINYDCPCGRGGHHRHDHRHEPENKHENEINKNLIGKESNSLKESKRKKTPSVASLPNYNEFKLSIAGETNIDKSDLEKHSSAQSLPDESKKPSAKSSIDKIDNYLTRARSFGSLLPTMLLHKLSTAKAPLAEIESDDSLVGLDDWAGLKMIENYTPKDSSLPRPKKSTKSDAEILADLEGMIEIEPPIPPVRKSESLIKKINDNAKRQASDRAERSKSVTPPPSPENEILQVKIPATELPLQQDGKVEHSNLMKILEEFSDSKRNVQPINDFLNAERGHFNNDCDFTKSGYDKNTIAT